MERTMNDIRIDIKVRNNRLVSLLESKYGNVAKFCKANGLQQERVGKYCNLKESPLKGTNKYNEIGWKDYAVRIADALGVLPDELWPEHMQELKLKVNTGFTTVTTDMVGRLLGSDPKANPVLTYEKNEAENLVANALRSLTEREQQVISLRFGLEDGEVLPLHAVGKVIGVTQERVRQIEAKALRKLRHPEKTEILKDLLED